LERIPNLSFQELSASKIDKLTKGSDLEEKSGGEEARGGGGKREANGFAVCFALLFLAPSDIDGAALITSWARSTVAVIFSGFFLVNSIALSFFSFFLLVVGDLCYFIQRAVSRTGKGWLL
jgi:hypothetical protein